MLAQILFGCAFVHLIIADCHVDPIRPLHSICEGFQKSPEEIPLNANRITFREELFDCRKKYDLSAHKSLIMVELSDQSSCDCVCVGPSVTRTNCPIAQCPVAKIDNLFQSGTPPPAVWTTPSITTAKIAVVHTAQQPVTVTKQTPTPYKHTQKYLNYHTTQPATSTIICKSNLKHTTRAVKSTIEHTTQPITSTTSHRSTLKHTTRAARSTIDHTTQPITSTISHKFTHKLTTQPIIPTTMRKPTRKHTLKSVIQVQTSRAMPSFYKPSSTTSSTIVADLNTQQAELQQTHLREIQLLKVEIAEQQHRLQKQQKRIEEQQRLQSVIQVQTSRAMPSFYKPSSTTSSTIVADLNTQQAELQQTHLREIQLLKVEIAEQQHRLQKQQKRIEEQQRLQSVKSKCATTQQVLRMQLQTAKAAAAKSLERILMYTCGSLGLFTVIVIMLCAVYRHWVSKTPSPKPLPVPRPQSPNLSPIHPVPNRPPPPNWSPVRLAGFSAADHFQSINESSSTFNTIPLNSTEHLAQQTETSV